MNRVTAFKYLMLAGLLCIVAGCKLAVIVVEGGEVQSGSGTYTPCLPGSVCIHPVADTTYSENFIAVPDAGWHFAGWNTGESFLCPNQAHPACWVSNIAVAENPFAEAIVASDATFYIMPVFKEGLPTVSVNGVEWAQPVELGALSWDEINAVCPAGVCAGTLKDFDMTGWTWATVDDVNALFNSYIGTPALGPGPDLIQDSTLPLEWVQQYYNDGWLPSYYDAGYYYGTYGWTATHAGNGMAYTAYMGRTSDEVSAWASTSYTEATDFVYPVFIPYQTYGGWFYR